jgi:PiT family inorganic phosphate transporter
MFRLHLLSAGATGFARGLNDTPKIAALLVASGAVGLAGSAALVALVMAAGGLLAASRVAHTMSFEITAMDDTQAFTANLVTASLVAAASPLGLPLSTTHVSTGALVGIGTASSQARWSRIGQILLAWITTMPAAALFAAAAAFVFTHTR